MPFPTSPQNFGVGLAEVLQTLGLWDGRYALPTNRVRIQDDDQSESEAFISDDEAGDSGDSYAGPVPEWDDAREIMTRSRGRAASFDALLERIEWENYWQEHGVDSDTTSEETESDSGGDESSEEAEVDEEGFLDGGCGMTAEDVDEEADDTSTSLLG